MVSSLEFISEDTSSKKTTGGEYSRIIKVLEIYIKKYKKIISHPGDKFFLHPLARKTEALVLDHR